MRWALLLALLCGGCQNVTVTLFVENDLGNGTRAHAEMAWRQTELQR